MSVRLQPARLGHLAYGVAAFLVAYAAALLTRAIWTPDGYDYLTRTLVFLGHSLGRARDIAQPFYATLPVGNDPRFAPLFRGEGPPQYWALFSPRLLFPYLASLLYPLRGPQALIDVARLASAATAAIVYALLTRFVRPMRAAVLAVMFALWPLTRALGSSALTDSLALCFLAACVLALVAIADRPRPQAVVAFAACAVLLSLSRPLTYIIFGGALGLVITGVTTHKRALTLAGIACATISVACTVAIAAIMHAAGAPGAWSIILEGHKAMFDAHAPPSHSLFSRAMQALLHFSASDATPVWYVKVNVLMVVRETLRAILFVAPLVAIYGISRLRRTPAFWPVVGVAAFALLSMPLNPWPGELDRTMEYTMYPVEFLGLALAADALERILAARLGRSAARTIAS